MSELVNIVECITILVDLSTVEISKSTKFYIRNHIHLLCWSDNQLTTTIDNQ